ncbi:MAG: hypothetical protein KDD53_09620, partial [Bdellovibrionales bacterium]|nr:hypothetical protein [Bdellovibrionales bacterium]
MKAENSSAVIEVLEAHPDPTKSTKRNDKNFLITNQKEKLILKSTIDLDSPCPYYLQAKGTSATNKKQL